MTVLRLAFRRLGCVYFCTLRSPEIPCNKASYLAGGAMEKDYTEATHREGGPETWIKSGPNIPAAHLSPAFQCDQPRHQICELAILDVPGQMNPQMTTTPSQLPML